MQFSNNQLSALNAKSSCFVFASAGSGKTKILVDRFVILMLNGIDANKILCITFTNAAVDEMKNRILLQLKALYINQNDYTQMYLSSVMPQEIIDHHLVKKACQLYFKFLDAFHKLKILTMHSFCQQILQKYPIEANINPNFEIIDNGTATILFDKAQQDAMLDNDALVEKAIHLFPKAKFMHYIQSVDKLKLSFFFMQNNCLDKYRKKLELLFKYRRQSSSDIDIEKIDISKYITKNNTIRKKLSPEDLTIAHHIFDQLTNGNKLKTIDRTIVLLQFLHNILERYNKLKNSSNYLDFDDILLKTYQLLNNESVSGFILKQISEIKAIMIDESQDLNSIQWGIIKIISEDILTDQNNLKTIFIVGDIKQSIYKFQGADHRLLIDFVEHCKTFLSHSKKQFSEIIFKMCYRTNQIVLDLVDDILCDKQYAFDNKYNNHITNNKSDRGSVYLISIDDIPSAICKLKSNNQKNKIMILSKNRNAKLNKLMQLIRSYGINIAQTNIIKIYDHLIIMDIVALIEICINTQNRYKMLCVAKSHYIFDNPLTNEEISSHSNDAVQSIDIIRQYNHIYSKLTDIIDFYNNNRFTKFLYWLISTQIIINHSAYEYDIVNIFFNEAITFFKSNNGVQDFLNYIKEYEILHHSSSYDNDNCIQIMTIHGAKGLEADTVFLLDFDLNPSEIMIDEIWSKNCDLFILKPNKSEYFNEIMQYVENELEEDRCERLRLLYVAMTRTINTLYIEDNGSISDLCRQHNNRFCTI